MPRAVLLLTKSSVLEGLIGEARFYVSGVDVTESVIGTGKTAVECAMGELVRRSYTGLQQITDSVTSTPET